MSNYYVLNPHNNTWSRTPLPLQAILAQPGITDAHLLADALTRKTFTVAQLRGTGRKPRLVAPEQSLLKTCMAKGCESSPQKMNASVVKVRTPQKAHSEYKVLSRNDACFGGRFDADVLTHVLNSHSRQGWHVLSCQMAAVSSDSGELRDELLVVLHRRVSACSG